MKKILGAYNYDPKCQALNTCLGGYCSSIPNGQFGIGCYCVTGPLNLNTPNTTFLLCPPGYDE